MCPADITITKTADELSKVGDPVTYTFEICNVGVATVTRDSVTDTLLGDISASFPATLAPGACATVELTRTVLDGDPDPLENTVTAIYSSGRGILTTTDTATASATTELFQPACRVSPRAARLIRSTVGGVETLHDRRHQRQLGGLSGPDNGTIVDTLTGDLLDPANTAVDSSDCTAVLATGGTLHDRHDADGVGQPIPTRSSTWSRCTTTRIGFPNDITATAHGQRHRVGPG